MEDAAAARVGRRIRQRRENELGLTRDQIRDRSRRVKEGGVSLSTLRALETGARTNYSDQTIAAVSYALGWTDDSLERLMHEDEPVERSDADDLSAPSPAGAEGWDVEIHLRPGRELSANEEELIKAEMRAAAMRALIELDRRGR